MSRRNWGFSYPANDLFAAAETKKGHHCQRLGWWKERQSQTMETIKAEGLEIDTSVAGRAGKTDNDVNPVRNSQVKIRADLLQDLRECGIKIEEHRHLSEEYDSWALILKSQGQASFVLDFYDWLFFFAPNPAVQADEP